MTTWPAPDRTEPHPEPGDERRALEERLGFLRATLLRKCAGLRPEQLAERAVDRAPARDTSDVPEGALRAPVIRRTAQRCARLSP